MQIINELVGIIEGISFDGVINEKEIHELQEWINKNKSLVCELSQLKLIKIVINSIEDGMVSDEERIQLLKYLEGMQIRRNDFELIYELNGIINGIACDGIINGDELHHFKKWRESYLENRCEDKELDKLYEIIDEIIDDGVFSKDRKQALFEVVSSKVSNSQFETKLSFLKKQISLKKNIGIDLIDLIDDKENLRIIHKRAEGQLKNALESYSGLSIMDPEVVVISLSLIAMLDYDGSFYEKVRNTYTALYKQFNVQKIEGLIRTILSKYRSESDLKNSEKRIINVALYNAIVPKHYLAAFFEFIFDIYKLNFEYDLPEDLYEEFNFIYEGLRNSMEEDTDSLQLNVTKKTYKLIKSTKQLIIDHNLMESIIKLSTIIVLLIDKRMWGRTVELNNQYLRSGFDEWCKILEDKELHFKEHKVKTRATWEPKYMLDGNDIILVPPTHKVKAQHNISSYYAQILENDRVIFETDDLEITEIIAGYKIRGKGIRITSPLNNISYRLVAGNTVLYDSKEKLNRSFIVFDQDGFEIKNNTDYNGIAVVCHRNKEKGFNPYWKCSNYCLTSKTVHYGDTLFISDSVFSFSALQKPGVFGELLNKHYVVPVGQKAKYNMYRQIKFLVFESEQRFVEHEIIINGVVHKLDQYQTSILPRDGAYKYVVEFPIVKAGVYNVKIIEYSKNSKKRIAEFSFVVDPTFNIGVMKMDEKEYSVSINTSFSTQTINNSINAKTYVNTVGQFTYGMHTYNFMVPFDLDLYRLSEKEWIPFSIDLWIGDIKADTFLDIHSTEIDEVIVYSSCGKELNRLELNDKDVFKRVEIGFLLSYKELFEYEFITFLKDGKVKKAIFCNNKCTMKDDTKIKFDPNKGELTIVPDYYGKGNVFCEIYNRNGMSVYKSDRLIPNNHIIVSNLSSFQRYRIVFYEKAKGISLNKIREMKTYERSLFARKDFVGSCLKITEVYYLENGEKRSKKLPRTYIDMDSMNDKGEYHGNIIWINEVNNYTKLHVPGVTVELCSDVINDSVEMIITKKGKNLDINKMFENAPWDSKQKNAEIISYTAEIKY